MAKNFANLSKRGWNAMMKRSRTTSIIEAVPTLGSFGFSSPKTPAQHAEAARGYQKAADYHAQAAKQAEAAGHAIRSSQVGEHLRQGAEAQRLAWHHQQAAKETAMGRAMADSTGLHQHASAASHGRAAGNLAHNGAGKGRDVGDEPRDDHGRWTK